MLKGYLQDAGLSNHYPLCCPLFAFGLDACLYSDMLKGSESIAACDEHTIDLFDQPCLWNASQHHGWFFLLLPEMQQKLRMQILYDGLLRNLGRLLCAYLCPLVGADEVSI